MDCEGAGEGAGEGAAAPVAAAEAEEAGPEGDVPAELPERALVEEVDAPAQEGGGGWAVTARFLSPQAKRPWARRRRRGKNARRGEKKTPLRQPAMRTG